MAELKTIRLKKLDNLKEFGEVEGRTYYVEENNTLYRDVLSTKMAVGQVYFIPNGIPEKDAEKITLTLSNVLVISNEGDIDNGERDYKIGMYDENGVYIDLSVGDLIKNISLDDNNNLVLTFEDGTTTSVPLNTLLAGVVKSVNGETPDASGVINLSYNNLEDLPNLFSGNYNDLDNTPELYTKTEIEQHLRSNYYNNTEVDDKDEAVLSHVRSNYYNKIEVDAKDTALRAHIRSNYFDKDEIEDKLKTMTIDGGDLNGWQKYN